MNKMVLVAQDRYDRLLRKCGSAAGTESDPGETVPPPPKPAPDTPPDPRTEEKPSPLAQAPIPPPGIWEESKAGKGKGPEKPKTAKPKRKRKEKEEIGRPERNGEESSGESEKLKEIVERWIHF